MFQSKNESLFIGKKPDALSGFDPQNAFERKLVAFKNKEIPISEFLIDLMNSNQHILSQTTETSKALVIHNKSKHPVLPIYTSGMRANPTIENMPAYKCLLQIHVGDFLMQVKDSIGIVMNPFWKEGGLEWSPDQIDQLKNDLLRGRPTPFHEALEKFNQGLVTKFELLRLISQSDFSVLVHTQNHHSPQKNILTATVSGEPHFCVFSNPELAEASKNAQPDFKQITLIHGKNLLDIRPSDYGFFVNPGSDSAIEFNPHEIENWQKKNS